MTPSLQKPVMYHKYSNDPNLTDKVKKWKMPDPLNRYIYAVGAS